MTNEFVTHPLARQLLANALWNSKWERDYRRASQNIDTFCDGMNAGMRVMAILISNRLDIEDWKRGVVNGVENLYQDMLMAKVAA